jgi:4-amino-4-deoxy-L-arabinose transferase-like glycosyltransferase
MIVCNETREITSIAPASKVAAGTIANPLRLELIVVLVAALIYLVGIISPPALMDDVDAAEALQAKNMLLSGDWVTQHLDGTPYLDKAPLKYWITAGLYEIFGIHDWVARLPSALAVILLCWLVFRIGKWADSPQTGFYSGIILATSIGLFLFTRTIIPDVILTLLITVSVWCFMRLLEAEGTSFRWAMGMYAAVGCAVLTKGFIGLVFPLGIAFLYLIAAGKLFDAAAWRRLHVLPGLLLFLVIAVPWHVLAVMHNPPYFDFTLHVGPDFGGKFRGFFWFYFINEQVLRFLNERWPRDYNTVPRAWFWLSHLVWFFPWTFFLPAVLRLRFNSVDRASRMRLLAVCWVAVVMVFFTFSTTQEYSSMPIYAAVALLLGSAMATGSKWLSIGGKIAGSVCLATAAIIAMVLIRVWSLPTPGDIYTAIHEHPDLYTLSLGHMADLTLGAFAYLRVPLVLAGLAFLIGGLGAVRLRRQAVYFSFVAMLVLFFQAARTALIIFDPYLSSRAVAQELNVLPQGTVIVCGKYNPLSSIFFYSRDKALQNDDDLDILEYGSLAPGAPKIAVSDEEMKHLWNSGQRVYIVAKTDKLEHLHTVFGSQLPTPILRTGDKYLFANHTSNPALGS